MIAVADYIHDGGYDSPHNAKVTWKNHLQQESEWEGEMWGKNANFLGVEEFGSGQRKPREIHDPGTYYEYNDVRINRFALSLARVFGKGIPDSVQREHHGQDRRFQRMEVAWLWSEIDR